MRSFGPKFLLEVAFLAAVAIATVVAELEWWAIVLVMALAYLLVVVFDVSVSRRRVPRDVEPPTRVEPQHVHVMPLDPDPAVQPVLERRPEPMPEPEPEAPPAPEPLPPAAELEDERPKLEVAPEPEPDPEPEPAAQPPVRESGPVEGARGNREVPPATTEPERVVALPVAQAPREWNVWELERLARERAGDAVQDEERAYLLVYLREFATPEGTLPVDFDALVRESFGELLLAAR